MLDRSEMRMEQKQRERGGAEAAAEAGPWLPQAAAHHCLLQCRVPAPPNVRVARRVHRCEPTLSARVPPERVVLRGEPFALTEEDARLEVAAKYVPAGPPLVPHAAGAASLGPLHSGGGQRGGGRARAAVALRRASEGEEGRWRRRQRVPRAQEARRGASRLEAVAVAVDAAAVGRVELTRRLRRRRRHIDTTVGKH